MPRICFPLIVVTLGLHSTSYALSPVAASPSPQTPETANLSIARDDTTVSPVQPAATDRRLAADPFERTNRRIFRFNERIDNGVLKPVAVTYRKVAPRGLRRGVTSFFTNLAEPVNIVNNLLQGKPRASAISLSRFTLNTVTSAGLYDTANRFFKLTPQREDFGQTLGVWGISSGPYLMLPFLGPSTLRDTAGIVGDSWLRPQQYLEGAENIGLRSVEIVNIRAGLLDVEDLVQGGDRYALLRDVYLQRRAFQVYQSRDGEQTSAPAPTVEEAFGDEPTGTTEPVVPTLAQPGTDVSAP